MGRGTHIQAGIPLTYQSLASPLPGPCKRRAQPGRAGEWHTGTIWEVQSESPARFVNILLRTFAYMFIIDIGLTFILCVIFSEFDIKVMLASYNEFGSISSSAIF